MKSNFYPLGFEIGRKKESRLHVYICSVEHLGNYCNPLIRTLNYLPYAVLEVLYLIVVLLLKTALVKSIVPLSKKLSIVFVQCSRLTIELKGHDPS